MFHHQGILALESLGYSEGTGSDSCERVSGTPGGLPIREVQLVPRDSKSP